MKALISKITINSSSKSSTSSAKPVGEITGKWGDNPVASCVLGISKIGIASNLIKEFSHAALLLLNKKIDYDEDDGESLQKDYGILVEYGDYNPNMCTDEENMVEKKYVEYCYGNKGGLRYYGKKYGEFCTEFGNCGYIDFNIKPDNQKKFGDFIESIAKKEENKWIQDKYSVGINNFNCHNFVLEALKILNPYFTVSNIFPNTKGNIILKGYQKKIEFFVPKSIAPDLASYYVKI